MMIFGIPIIATKVEGNREILKNNMGILCNTNSNSLKNSIKKFYKLSIKQKKLLSKNAKNFAYENFEISIIAKKEFKIYKSIINE